LTMAPVENFQATIFRLHRCSLQIKVEFCYLGDVVGSSGDVQSSVTARIRAGWQKFSELSQVLCGRTLPQNSVIEAERS